MLGQSALPALIARSESFPAPWPTYANKAKCHEHAVKGDEARPPKRKVNRQEPSLIRRSTRDL